jgi:parvulin-like peptidyl-prolyl isomerase
MIDTVKFTGVKATVRNTNFRFLTIAFLAFVILALTGCPSSNPTNSSSTNIDPNETAATVNGKAIKLEEVERVIKQQGQGQESKLSPLELAQARLQVLENLIQQEVLFQKAEKEGTVPNEDDVTAEVNKRKTESRLSQEEFQKQMTQAGFDDKSFRESVKRELAIRRLIDKVTGKIEPPKDSEITDFYNGNKAAFVKKKGVKLAAIVIDPADNGEGDTTKTEADAVRVGNEILNQLKTGADFATVARERSEDQQSRLQGGDLGYISEDELKQGFPPNVAAALMNPQFQVGQMLPTPMQGKFYIFKLQERSDKDENLTLESPGIRQQVTDSLINARKQLLSQSYAAIAMNEAKIENFLAQKVVTNPNELSGARPAGMDTPTPTNTNANVNANAATNTNANAAANNTKTNANTAANSKPANKPAANTNGK